MDSIIFIEYEENCRIYYLIANVLNSINSETSVKT